MVRQILIVGLVVIPFAHMCGIDQAWLKEWLGINAAMAIAFYAFYTRGIQCIKNHWVLLSIGAMMVSTMFVPTSQLCLGAVKPTGAFVFTDLNIDNVWNFEPILLAITYLLMVCAIAQEEWDVREIMSIIAWVGFLMALVVFAQKAGFQEFWRIRDPSEIGGAAKNLAITGFMAQYTLVASFLALCFVSALLTSRWWFCAAIGAAILITQSHFAIFSIIISTALYFVKSYKQFLVVLALLFVTAFVINHFVHFQDDGRYAVWKQIYHDMTSPIHDVKNARMQGFTGFGAGAFALVFPILHNSPWGKAHNEFIEFLFDNGIFGLGIFLTAIGLFFRDSLKNFDQQYIKFGLLSFLAACVLSCGTFLWHLGWAQFYTAAILGIAYSVIRKAQDGKGLAKA